MTSVPHNCCDWLMRLFTVLKKEIQHNLKNESDTFSRCYILIVLLRIICMENKTNKKKPTSFVRLFLRPRQGEKCIFTTVILNIQQKSASHSLLSLLPLNCWFVTSADVLRSRSHSRERHVTGVCEGVKRKKKREIVSLAFLLPPCVRFCFEPD